MQEIWFWQRIVSPHIAGLAVALARLGCNVTYVAEQGLSDDRASQGWTLPVTPGVNVIYAETGDAVAALAQTAPTNAVHICQGIRANGLVGVAQRSLAARGLLQWVLMETVNDDLWYGQIKRAVYSRLFHVRAASLQGVLAAGHRTTEWVSARGMPADRVFPFAYFLPHVNPSEADGHCESKPYRFIFAGQLIRRKRVDWLITALAGLRDRAFELCIVGAGPEEPALRALAARELGDRVRWLGQLPLSEVSAVMAQADCLVLPSVHDGWGAVVSEALMVGTPAICSDACGVAGVVQASGAGGVFPVDERLALAQLLAEQASGGVLPHRHRAKLAAWASCLGADAGARYLLEILAYNETGQGNRPVSPWMKEVRLCVD